MQARPAVRAAARPSGKYMDSSDESK